MKLHSTKCEKDLEYYFRIYTIAFMSVGDEFSLINRSNKRTPHQSPMVERQTTLRMAKSELYLVL